MSTFITIRRKLTEEEIAKWRKDVVEQATAFFAANPDRQTCIVEIDPSGETIEVGRESLAADVEAVHSDQ